MEPSAQKQKVLLTDVGSYLGQNLAESFLTQGLIVYGSGKGHPKDKVLTHENFTLIDIDLSQPLHSHLPQFDLCIHLSSEVIESSYSLNSASKNVINLTKEGKTKVFLCAPLESSPNFLDTLAINPDIKKNLKIFLIGDIYGPDNSNESTHSYYSQNPLTKLIKQATQEDKIILDKEGLELIYPTYIKDAIYAINKFIFQSDSRIAKFIVSQSQITSLSVSYEIQNIIRSTLNKELAIYFKGPEHINKPEPEPIVRIPDLGFSPKFKLEDGLEEILKDLQKDKSEIKHLGLGTHEQRAQVQSEAILEAKTSTEKSKTTRVFKLPHLNFKLKGVIIALLLTISILTIKSAIDIYIGISQLKSAKNSLYSKNFQNAKNSAGNAISSFQNVQGEAAILLYPIGLVAPEKVSSINAAIKSAELASGAFLSFTEGAEILEKNLEIIVNPAKTDSLDFESPRAMFSDANFKSSYSQGLANQAKNISLIGNKVSKLDGDLAALKEVSKISYDLTTVLGELTGENSQKKYLILLLNNTELRPGGGFIGSYGEVSFEKGKLKELKVDDIYNIDGQLKEKIEAPIEITQRLGEKQLFLRDSNWTVDFAINAKTARDFYRKETGRTVDGVIAFDLSYMQRLLEKIGPIRLDDYKEDITAQNLFEKGEYYSEVGFFPGSTQKKDFFSTFANALLNKLISSLSHEKGESWLPIIEVTKESVNQKHLMISLDSEKVSPLIKSNGWDNLLPPYGFNPNDNSKQARDFIALSEANLGANKSNRFIERDVKYEMTIGKEADLMADLTIAYKNNSQANTWPAGTYVNFLRVYTPNGSAVEQVLVGDEDITSKVNVESAANLSAFSTFIEVPIKETKTIRFKYRVPKNIQLEKAPTYSLYFQKQPGTEKDSFSFFFNLPSYIKTTSVNGLKDEKQNIELHTDLSVDRHFEIEVAKK